MPGKFQDLHQKLTSLRNKAIGDLHQKHRGSVAYLRKKLLLPEGFKDKSKRLLAGATLAGSLLFNPLNLALPNILDKPAEERMKIGLATAEEVKKLLAEKIANFVPGEIGKLSDDDKDKVCQVLKEVLGVDVCFNLEGNEINYSYGWIGYEQHLPRYPGDTLEEHDEELVAGITPGLGAWGYFAESKEALTKEDYLKEKYYAVVQTLYFDDWPVRSEEIYNWFKHRKVIVVNPENGTACIGIIGDAGPAQWTGKQFGGSPELMKALDLHLEWRKGKVFILFVNDPDNKVPLGPIDFNLIAGIPQVV